MSLLAAMAKGLGVGTLDNAKVGFAEQQRKREAEQRKAEQSAEWQQRGAQLDKQLQASREDTDKRLAAQEKDTQTRLSAQAEESRLDREQQWALFEKKLSVATSEAAASANAKYREANAQNIAGHLDALSKQRNELLANDKISDEQRAIALGEIDYFGNTIVSDPGTQALLNEIGGGGRITYWSNLKPKARPGANTQGGGTGGGSESKTEPPPQQFKVSEPPPYAKPGYAFSGVIGHIQRGGGGSMAAGYDPQYRQPLNVAQGKPIKLSSDFSLPTDDSHVPAYARYNK
ncbi:hypothetical protein SAMN05880558_11336 [Aeromonas sp. RU39B]|uniref:hypothetical protein n=1 Tax=Aeromonas sp. RU39B TaxID=1907416 RepID=UPI00095588A7|nr:hypothetical protein [Aeromonas sp. RU39B]SIR40314.1 hypothetical protein SAMN05880558_11336 [Aeromonas sp. RU39B]